MIAGLILGVCLVLAVFAVASYVKNARDARLHRRRLTKLEQWAQGLGPRGGQGRGRP